MKGSVKFNNPTVAIQSWYVAAPSKAVRRGQVKSYDLLDRRIALFRDQNGTVHALDARCAHLGADLGQGQVVGNQLQCAFHHWCYDPDGSCRRVPGLDHPPRRRVRRYPTQEKWGLIWIFNGPRPLFTLPEPPSKAGERYRHFRPPPQHINCHPHLVIANGLDITHFESLHGMVFSTPPRLIVDEPYQLTLEVRGRPDSRLLQHLTGSRQQDIVASFTTLGGNLAWAEVREPIRFYMLFTGLPSSAGGCQTQTVFFFPAKPAKQCLQAILLMYTLLRDDHRILDSLMFSPGFTEQDESLKCFAKTVNAMETW